MDFEKILDDWENGKIEKAKKAKTANHWLDQYEPGNSDINSKAGSIPRKERGLSLDRKLRKDPQDVIDLHGYNGEEAAIELNRFLKRAKRRKLDKVLIIHGKGNNSPNGPVLPKIVRKVLEESSDTGQFGFADYKSGGKGATWVIIR